MATTNLLVKRRRNETIRSFVSMYKENTPCADCGRYYHTEVMEFDHIGNTKRDSVSKMVSWGLSLKVILAEVRKCELVCANCHRIRTTSRRSKS